METVTLHHTLSGTSVDLPMMVMGVKGADEPDEWEPVAPIQRQLLNGTLLERIPAYRRILTVDFGVVSDPAQRAGLFAFLRNSDRSITCRGMEIAVVLDSVESMAAEWVDDCEAGRRYVVRLKEKLPQTGTGFPGAA